MPDDGWMSNGWLDERGVVRDADDARRASSTSLLPPSHVRPATPSTYSGSGVACGVRGLDLAGLVDVLLRDGWPAICEAEAA